MLKIESMNIDEMPLGLLAQSFRDFYHRDPWNEYLWCPSCGLPDSFGALGRYEDPALENCPVCNAILEDYWSDSRVTSYFRHACSMSRFYGVVGKNEAGEIVAWVWGYDVRSVPDLSDMDQDGIYIDVIGVMPEYRDDTAQFAVEGHILAMNEQFKYFVTRTHSQAEYVKQYASSIGYKFLRKASEFDREYWVLIP